MTTATLTHSTEIEQSVIGALLLFGSAFDRIAEKVEAEDFATASHRSIFEHIRRLVQAGKPVDIQTVHGALEAAGVAEAVGGLAYLAEMANNTPGASAIEYYAGLLRDKRIQRDILALSDSLHGLATQANMSGLERIDAAMSMAMQLGQRQTDSEPVDVGDTLSHVVDAIQSRADANEDVSGLATGFRDLDEITGGLQPGDLVVVAGRPSMGKTTLAMNFAEHASVGLGLPTLVFSLEMGERQLAERSLAAIGEVPTKAMRSGRLTDDQWQGLSSAVGRLNVAPMVIDASPSLSAQQMLIRARRVKRRKQGLALIVIDYLQLMRGEGNNRNEELGDITRTLKLLARDLGCPVVLLSQLSRKCEERADKRPVLSDLRESGAIEQDADLVLMAYRDDYYDPDSYSRGCAEILIRKHRMGECGVVTLAFQGEFSRFRNAHPGELARLHAEALEHAQRTRLTTRRRILE